MPSTLESAKAAGRMARSQACLSSTAYSGFSGAPATSTSPEASRRVSVSTSQLCASKAERVILSIAPLIASSPISVSMLSEAA